MESEILETSEPKVVRITVGTAILAIFTLIGIVALTFSTMFYLDLWSEEKAESAKMAVDLGICQESRIEMAGKIGFINGLYRYETESNAALYEVLPETESE